MFPSFLMPPSSTLVSFSPVFSKQGKMEKTGCKIICGAPTTLAVKGLMMMMMMNDFRHLCCVLGTVFLNRMQKSSIILCLPFAAELETEDLIYRFFFYVYITDCPLRRFSLFSTPSAVLRLVW